MTQAASEAGNVENLDEHRRRFTVIPLAALEYDDVIVSAVRRIEWLGDSSIPRQRIRDGMLLTAKVGLEGTKGDRLVFFSRSEALGLAIALEQRRPCEVRSEDDTKSTKVRFSWLHSGGTDVETLATVGNVQFSDPISVARTIRALVAEKLRRRGTQMVQVSNAQLEIMARSAHEANRAYCLSIGDTSQPSWDDAPGWQRSSALNGVSGALAGDTPEQSHESWLEEKRRTGWKYGPVKDPEKKEHPCFVSYSELPPEQQVKDAIFTGVVRSVATALGVL